VVGAAVAVIVAALAGWFLAGTAEQAPPDGGAQGITSAQPAPGALPQTPVATGPAGQSLPAPTDLPGQPPIAGGGPGVSSVSPGGSAQVSPSVGEGTPGSSGSPAASAAPRGTRLTSKGGVVYATCGGGKATLTSWQPAQGYSVEKVNQGPGLAAVIVFKGPSDKYRMTVTCVAGTPTPVVLPL